MEAFAIYDVMMYVKPPIRTMCVGTAFGEAAMLLAAGTAGMRGALPSATIMLRQPINRYERMQASDIDIYRNELRYDFCPTLHIGSKLFLRCHFALLCRLEPSSSCLHPSCSSQGGDCSRKHTAFRTRVLAELAPGPSSIGGRQDAIV